MEYEYIRKLIVTDSEADANQVLELLEQNGIEVFSKTETKRDYVYADSNTGCLNNEVYVAGADRERAAELVTELGFSEQICPDIPVPEAQSELEKAEEQFFRKKKRTMIEGLVILVIAFIYMIVRMYMV